MAKRGPQPQPNPELSEAVGTRAAEAAETISKMDAVRACLAELGADAKPRDAVPWIKSRYNLDVPPGIFSSYKRSINLAAAEAATGGNREGGTFATPPTPSSTRTAPVSRPAAVLGSAPPTENPAEAVRAVRQLVDRWGAEFVRELVDLLGPAR